MLQFLPVADTHIIAVRASGKLSHEDYQNFLPQLEEKIASIEHPSILLELDNFLGWDLEAAKDDLHFVMQHNRDFERVAIVGDKAWEHWMVAMVKPFLPSNNARYFDREALKQAWSWLREPTQQRKAAEQLTPYQSIVVAVDFSLYAQHAARRALELADFYQAPLTFLHITEEILPYYGDAMMLYPLELELLEEQNKQRVDAAKQQMEGFIKTLPVSDKMFLHSRVISGDVETAMLSFIEAQQVDLMVFGGKKKTTLDKLLGSVPHYIQNHANCDVLVTPLQEVDSFKALRSH